MKILKLNKVYLYLELDNGNVLCINEADSGTIHITNATASDSLDDVGGLGLAICPISESSISITPEG